MQSQVNKRIYHVTASDSLALVQWTTQNAAELGCSERSEFGAVPNY